MRIVLSIIGLLCLLMGGIWFFQGINVIRGSFMTGQTKWAIYGGITFAVGIALIITGKRRGA